MFTHSPYNPLGVVSMQIEHDRCDAHWVASSPTHNAHKGRWNKNNIACFPNPDCARPAKKGPARGSV